MRKAGNRCGIMLFVLFAVVLLRPDAVQAADLSGDSGDFPSTIIAESTQYSSSVVAASGSFLDAMTETEEVDVYDYEALEEVIESSVSLASSSSDVEERRAWLKEAMEEALLTFTEKLDVSGHGITEEDLIIVGVNVINADYRFCYVDSSYSYSRNSSTGIVSKVYFTYTAESEEAIQMLAELEAAVDEVVSYADDSWSDMEKALFINDYLCRTCEYDTSSTGEDHTAYGALVEHCTVCEGYAKAFYAIGQRMGLNCGVVVSVDLGHEWSYVQVGDSYYYVDVTWDDPTTDRLGQAKHTYFLKSYSYFHSGSGGHTTDDWIYAGCDTNDDDDAGDTDDAEDIADTDDADDVNDADNVSDADDASDADYTASSDDSGVDGTELSEEDFADTSYDDYFWDDITQGFEYIDGYWYTVNNRDIETYVCDGSSFTYEDTLLTVSDIWYVWGSTSSYYASGYSGIASYDGILYYSTPTAVWAYDVSADEASDDDAEDTSTGSASDDDAEDTSTDDSTSDDDADETSGDTADGTEADSSGESSWEVYTLSDEYAELGYIYGIRIMLDGSLDIRLSTKSAASGTAGNYTVLQLDTASKTDLADCTILVDDSALVYDGTALLPEVTITDGDYTLIEGKDYVIASLDNISPGEKILYAAGLGDYSGVLASNFTIAMDMSGAAVTLSDTSYTYNGSAKEPTVTVTMESATASGETVELTEGTDYTVSYSNNTNAGTAMVIVTGCGNYTGSATATFTISKASQTVTASAGSSTIVNGKTTAITASTTGDGVISYSSSDTSVVKVSSGTVTAKGVGTATITVTAAATTNYKKATKTITIKVKPTATTISSVTNTSSGVRIVWKKVTGATGYYIYRATSSSGTYKKIATITSGSTVSYTNSTSGTYKVSSGTTYYYKVYAYASTGTSSASSAKSIRYLAAGKVSSLTNTSSGITVKWPKVTGASGYYIYRKTGSGSYTKIATVSGGSTVSYTNKTSGTYKVSNGTTYTYKVIPYYKNSAGTITTGSYSTTKKTVRLTAVSISSVKNTSSKKLTVKWGKNTKATGYQIQYSTSSSFSSYKTVTVSGTSSVSKVISSLSKGKTYYVRVRVYKTVSGTKYYSAWSAKKSAKVSK